MGTNFSENPAAFFGIENRNSRFHQNMFAYPAAWCHILEDVILMLRPVRTSDISFIKKKKKKKRKKEKKIKKLPISHLQGPRGD